MRAKEGSPDLWAKQIALAEVSSLQKERLRSPAELGIFQFPGTQNDFKKVLRSELRKGDLESQVLLSEDIQEAREFFISKIWYHLLLYRHYRKFQSKTSIEKSGNEFKIFCFYLSLGSLMGLIHSSEIGKLPYHIKDVEKDIQQLNTKISIAPSPFALSSVTEYHKSFLRFSSPETVDDRIKRIREKEKNSPSFILVPGSYRPLHVSHTTFFRTLQNFYYLVVGINSTDVMRRLQIQGRKSIRSINEMEVLDQLGRLPCLDPNKDQVIKLDFIQTSLRDQAKMIHLIRQLGVQAVYVGHSQEKAYPVRVRIAQQAGATPVKSEKPFGVTGSRIEEELQRFLKSFGQMFSTSALSPQEMANLYPPLRTFGIV